MANLSLNINNIIISSIDTSPTPHAEIIIGPRKEMRKHMHGVAMGDTIPSIANCIMTSNKFKPVIIKTKDMFRAW